MLTVNRILAVLFVAIGLAILVRTIAIGGGQVGLLAGVVFLALGVLRLRAAGWSSGRHEPPAGPGGRG
jgi:hypothetical protein